MNTLEVLNRGSYAIVRMNRGKVNAINFEMVQELSKVFTQLENDIDINGVILTGQPRYFSAGLVLSE